MSEAAALREASREASRCADEAAQDAHGSSPGARCGGGGHAVAPESPRDAGGADEEAWPEAVAVAVTDLSTPPPLRRSGDLPRPASAPAASHRGGSATSGGGLLRGARKLLDVEVTLLGILSQLAAQLASGRWSHVVAPLASADPLSALLVWRAQRSAAASRAADGAYFGDGCGAPSAGGAAAWGAFSCLSPAELLQLRRGGAHAFAVYGTFADAFARRGAGLRAWLRGGYAATHGALRRPSATSSALAPDHQAAPPAGGTPVVADAEATAAAAAAGIPCDDILSACWAPGPFQPCAYVALDREQRWVVLAVRGTLSGHDTLTDACAEPVPFLCGFAHAGMAAAAWQVVRQHVPTAAAALAANPGFSLLIAGHSMGGGVAALAAALCASDDADVAAAAARGAAAGAPADAGAAAAACAAVRCARAVAIACPSVASLALAVSMGSNVTSLIAGDDVVPRLSVASVQRLSHRLAAAWRPARSTTGAGRRDDTESDDNAVLSSSSSSSAASTHDASLWRGGGVELRDLRAAELLCPAGRCVHLQRLSAVRPAAIERHPAAFTDIQLSASMLSDHLPSAYAHALERLALAADEAMLLEAGDFEGAARCAAELEAHAPPEAQQPEPAVGADGRADAAVLAMVL